MNSLPIDPYLPELRARVRSGRAVVLEAPPGAGKTTRVPRALLDELPSGEILVLEPRRIAARMAAGRVAEELGEPVGQRVGYAVRLERRASSATRVLFVTEGIVTRRLTSDRDLRGVSAVVLDEIHERHIHGDVAMALVRRLRETTRPDLSVVAMSATLDARRTAEFLGAEVLTAEGRTFPVSIEHEAEDDRALELRVASAIRRLAREGLDGDILVFLPGAREIRLCEAACAEACAAHGFDLVPLHGDLPAAAQDRAVRPGPRAKVILSTNIAESSLTIEGVVAVIDSGLARVASHSPWSGIGRLLTAKASQASCVQRAGRAGRTRPGRAIRLYTAADFRSRPAQDTPELLRADLAPTWLELVAMRATDVRWLDAPPPEAVTAAQELLARLGALDAGGELTDVGRKLVAMPLHPRLGRLLLEAERRGVGDDGAALAAILEERDIVRASGDGWRRGSHDVAADVSDVLSRLDLLRDAAARGFSADAMRALGLDPQATRAVARTEESLRRGRREATAAEPDDRVEALLIATLAGFPDRVARRKSEGGRELALGTGGVAQLDERSAVVHAPLLVALDAEVVRGRTVVRLASAVEPEWLLDAYADRIREVREVEFDERSERVVVRSRLLYDAIAIEESESGRAEDPRVSEVLFLAARARGAHRFAPEGALERWVERTRHAAAQDARVAPIDAADVDAALRALCDGKRSLAELAGDNLVDWLRAAAPHAALVDSLAPDRILLPSGRHARVEYRTGAEPFVASYLQDFFGLEGTPKAGREPLVMHLLAPNRRAVQVTRDLPSFFSTHYPKLRKELMRKYPRHAWPEDPSVALPKRFG